MPSIIITHFVLWLPNWLLYYSYIEEIPGFDVYMFGSSPFSVCPDSASCWSEVRHVLYLHPYISNRSNPVDRWPSVYEGTCNIQTSKSGFEITYHTAPTPGSVNGSMISDLPYTVQSSTHKVFPVSFTCHAMCTVFLLNSWSLLCEIDVFSHGQHICIIKQQQGTSRNPRFACCTAQTCIWCSNP